MVAVTGTINSLEEAVSEDEQVFLIDDDEVASQGDADDNSRMTEEEDTNVNGEVAFLKFFATARGPRQVILVILLTSLSQGSTVGVIPSIVTDRYARLNYGYEGPPCSSFDEHDVVPPACRNGSNRAQQSAAISNFIRSIFSFVTSSLMGSISDKRGRRGILISSLALAALAPIAINLVNSIESMNPAVYYGADAVRGIVFGGPLFLSSLSDVMPPKWRAGSFGVFTAVFALGYAFAPLFAVAASVANVCIISLVFMLISLIFAICFLPETLPTSIMEQSTSESSDLEETWQRSLLRGLARPMKELGIIKRSRLFIFLSCLSLFAGMVLSADATFTIYYIENHLHFDDRDIAVFFIVLGVTAIFTQGVVLKPLTAWIGEKMVLIVAFIISTLHSFLYGLAKSKEAIYVAAAAAGVAGMALPTIGSVMANNVDRSEQGRVQGALYSLSSLASGLGPIFLQIVYSYVKDTAYPGPGGMFIAAGILQIASIFISCFLPQEQTNFSKPSRIQSHETNATLTEALLEDSDREAVEGIPEKALV